MTPQEAEDLAARTLAAIDAAHLTASLAADRERVISDLAGVRACYRTDLVRPRSGSLGHARRYAEGLTRTARLYGVNP